MGDGRRQDTSETAITVEVTQHDSSAARLIDLEGDIPSMLSDADNYQLPAPFASDIPRPPVSVGAVDVAALPVDRGEIARGGMGSIRLVYEPRLRRELALKRLTGDAPDAHDAGQRFLEEAQITGQLDHPNIVPVHELGADEDGNLFFTMKLVRGHTLADMLYDMGDERLQARNLETLLKVLVKVCEALSFAHAHGVMHRDLKPNNIMTGSHGQVYVMDWGLAALFDGERLASDEGKVIGTPGYMSPEQAWGDNDLVDGRSDVYSLGAMLYRVLTSRRPHPGTASRAIVRHTREGEIAPPQSVTPHLHLPPELCRIAMKALERSKADRYQSIEAFKGDIEQFMRGGGWLETRTVPAGTLIIQQGGIAEEAYIVVEGECEAFKMIEGRRMSLRLMGAGEVFGETALFTGKRRTANVVAREQTTLKIVTRKSIQRELAQNDWMASFVNVLAERFCELDNVVTELRTKYEPEYKWRDTIKDGG